MAEMKCSYTLDDIGESAVIVAAHPDDEILWFSSLLSRAKHILICYLAIDARPDWTNGRKQVLDQFPLRNVQSLDLKETDVFDCSDWQYPKINSCGMEIRGQDCNRNQYEANFHLLVDRLRTFLQPDTHVFTHNPWGEYGHEEHVQVFRAVETLQTEIGFHVWVPNFISNRSLPLMLNSKRMIDYRFLQAPSDPILASQIRELYRRYNCWTWYWDFHWLKEEVFMKIAPRNQRRTVLGQTLPLHFIDVGEAGKTHPFVRKTDSLVRRLFRARNRMFASRRRY